MSTSYFFIDGIMVGMSNKNSIRVDLMNYDQDGEKMDIISHMYKNVGMRNGNAPFKSHESFNGCVGEAYFNTRGFYKDLWIEKANEYRGRWVRIKAYTETYSVIKSDGRVNGKLLKIESIIDIQKQIIEIV